MDGVMTEHDKEFRSLAEEYVRLSANVIQADRVRVVAEKAAELARGERETVGGKLCWFVASHRPTKISVLELVVVVVEHPCSVQICKRCDAGN